MKRLLRLWLPGEVEARRAALRAAAWTGVLLGVVAWLVARHADDWPSAAERFMARGHSRRAELVALEWVWKALVVDGVLLAGLLLTVRWWSMPAGGETGRGGRAVARMEAGRRRTGVLVALLVVTGVALAVRSPRMTLSLYNDEAHNYARLWSGAWQEKGGETKLDEPRWGETLFWNGAGNNSQLFSVAARACLEGAERLGWRAKGEVTEWAARLPALAAGLGMLLVMGGLGRRRWGDGGMVVVMLVLALHPWHARYSTEARGYSFLLLGIGLMLWFGDRALTGGRWRDWAGYGAGLFLSAVSFLGSMAFLACFSAGLMWGQWGEARRSGDWSRLARPMVASLLAAMAGLVLLWPMIPPLLRVLAEHHSIRGEMGWRWWKDVGGYVMAGTRWVDAAVDNPVNLAMGRWVTGWWWGAVAAWVALVLGGMRLLWAEGGVLRVMSWAGPVSVVLLWAMMAMKGNFLNHWYVLHLVPWVVLVFAAAAARLMERRRWLGPVAAGVALLVPGRVALAQRKLPKQHEREPVVEALGAAYPGAGKREPRPMLGAFWCNSGLYHPEVVVVRDATVLEGLVRRSREEGRPLYVCFSHRPVALANNRELVEAVEDEATFERVAVYHGQEESQYSTHLFRLRR